MRGHSVVIVSIHGSLAQIVRGLRCLVKDHGRFYNGSGVMQLERQNTEAGAICKRMAGLFRSSLGPFSGFGMGKDTATTLQAWTDIGSKRGLAHAKS